MLAPLHEGLSQTKVAMRCFDGGDRPGPSRSGGLERFNRFLGPKIAPCRITRQEDLLFWDGPPI